MRTERKREDKIGEGKEGMGIEGKRSEKRTKDELKREGERIQDET